MTTKLPAPLVTLAARVIDGESETELEFGQGTDYQGELYLSWDGLFHAHLIVYSEPRTTYGGYYQPPETTWREQVDTFEAVKIKAVAEWLRSAWSFDLEAV